MDSVTRSPEPSPPGSGVRLGKGRGGVAGWPRRRWIAAAVLVLPLGGVFGSVGPLWSLWWAAPAALASGGLAAVIFASYLPLPGAGRRLDLGCSPCAAMAAASVVGALILRASVPLEGGMALVSLMMMGFGLAQRLANTTCAVGA